ncbi:MAG: glycosyltransferase family 39 protein [Verrucomicrobiae bacterium]|nr:glycosyltransferase family 39 protein [Verrucomicrobiae bacterium]
MGSRVSYLLLFFFALGVRLVYLFQQANANPLFDFPVVDASIYSGWADEIVRGKWWWPDLRNYLPVYPWFLAVCKWFFFGDHPWGVKLVQSLLSSMACVLLAAASSRLFGRRAGCLAGLFFAGNWLLALGDGELYSENFCLCCLAAFLYLFLVAAPGWGRTLLAGAACALACGCRPNLMPLIPLAAGWFFFTKQKMPLKAGHAAAFLGMSFLLFAPILYHNHQVSGRWMLRAQQNWNLYAAMDPAIGGLHPAAGIDFDKWMKKPVLAGYCSHEDQNDYWGRQVRQLLGDRPWDAAFNFLVRRGLIFFDAVEWSQEFDVHAFRSYSSLLSLPWPGFGWIFPLACVGLAGMLARWKRRDDDEKNEQPAHSDAMSVCQSRWFLLACLVVAILFTFVCKAAGRYRLPVVFFLMPFAGAGLDLLVKMGWERQWRPALSYAAVFLAAGLVSWPDWADLRHRQTAMHDFYVGQKFQKAGRPNDAEAAFRMAMARQPWDANAPCELARLLWQGNRLPEAMEAIEESLRREPEFWRAWNLKASLAMERKQFDLAKNCIDRSLAIMPVQPEPWMMRSRIYAATGCWADENAAFQQAIKLGAGAAFMLSYGLRLEDRQLYREAFQQYAAVVDDSEWSRFDQARACLLAGYVAALRLKQPGLAGEIWKKAAGFFSDVPFFADQALFLAGRLPEDQYAARARALNNPTAMEFYDFNRGVRWLLLRENNKAADAFRDCLVRGRVSPDASSPPAGLPQKWAWALLKDGPPR